MLVKKKKKKDFEFLKINDPLRYSINTFTYGVVFNNSNITSCKYNNYALLKNSKLVFFEESNSINLEIKYFDKRSGKYKIDNKILYDKINKEYAEIITYKYV